MLVLARGITAAIVVAVLALAGVGARPGPAQAEPFQFKERWGDPNCSGTVQSLDALIVLHHVAGSLVLIPEGVCEYAMLFPDTIVQVEGGPQVQWADVDCGGGIAAVDALWVLRYVVGLGNAVAAGCPEAGALTTLWREW